MHSKDYPYRGHLPHHCERFFIRMDSTERRENPAYLSGRQLPHDCPGGVQEQKHDNTVWVLEEIQQNEEEQR